MRASGAGNKSTETARLIRDGEKEVREYGGGGRGRLYTYRVKMEGLVYLQKYGIGGPEFGIKEEFVPEYGRQLFHARAMNREACCLQLGQLTASGFTRERRLYCTPRPH